MDSAIPPALTEMPKGNDKIWAILSHLSALMGVGFLLPLVVYLAMKDDSAYVRDNAREALNFHLSLLIYGLCCLPLLVLTMIPFVGIFAAPLSVLIFLAIGIGVLILAILAAIKASDGGCYHYPLTLRLIK